MAELLRIAETKSWLGTLDGWLRSRIGVIIWKRWKKPRTKYRKLIHCGVKAKYAYMAANTRRGCWFVVHARAIKSGLSNKRLDD